jgi:hypothetical protein
MRSSVENIELMQQIKELHRKNYSTSEIGTMLGYTKNQIVGLINRGRESGYDFPKRKTEFTKYKMAQARIKSDKVKAAQYDSVRKVTDIRDLYYITEVNKIPAEGLQLLDMPNNGCRYPIGERDDTHLFCSQQQTQGSYCLKHAQVIWPNKYVVLKKSRQ